MVQGCQQLRLALKTAYALGVVGKAFGQNLQGNIAAQPGIARAIDFAHRAGAYDSGDLIRAYPGPVASTKVGDGGYFGNPDITKPDWRPSSARSDSTSWRNDSSERHS